MLIDISSVCIFSQKIYTISKPKEVTYDDPGRVRRLEYIWLSIQQVQSTDHRDISQARHQERACMLKVVDGECHFATENRIST